MGPANKNQKANFEHLADSLPQIIWTANPDGFLDYYNERWYQFTGQVRGSSGDQSWLPLLHPDEAERVKSAWYHSVSTGEDFSHELRFLDHKKKSYTWFLGNARAARNENGEIIKWYGSCTDIDRQKKAEQQVVDILEGMNDAFFAIDANWILTRVNSRMEQTTNIRREEAVGKNFFLSFPMEKDSKYWINHHKIMEERVSVQYEEYYEPLDLWTEARGYPTPDGGIAYLFRDITPEKRALKKLEELTIELKEAVKVRDEFISIASHELLTPVTALKLQLQLAQKVSQAEQESASPLVSKLSRLVDNSNKQIDRLITLVAGLLDISRIEAGKMTYDFKDVNFSELVVDVVSRYSDEFERIGSSINLKVQPEISIKCDPVRMEQVIVNLFSNALKYGEGKAIDVALERSGSEVLFIVRDYGLGIAEDKQSEIYNRFERAISGTNISGLGLGLYIARQIVEAHGGKITLESAENQGACFTIHLSSI